MNSRVCIFFFPFSFLLLCSTLSAQKKSSVYEIGAAIGGFVYQGDLAPGVIGSWKTTKPGLILQGSGKIN